MKTKDILIVTLAPLPVLLIPLIGCLVSKEWKWTGSDFLFAYIVFALTAFAFRLLLTRKWSNLTYKLGAGLGVLAGFLITWITMAVQIIGDENPANMLYPLIVLLGAIGIVVSRFHPAGMAKVAFGMATALFLLPIVAFLIWPTDFNPGFFRVFLINLFFVAMFASSALLFKKADKQTSTAAVH